MELEILENTKMLLGITDDSSDDLLKFLIKDTTDAITAYCRIETLPRQLYGIAANIAAELYRSYGYGNDTPPVKSITEGERRIEFESGSGRFTDFAARLEPFVNKSARLPSQMEAHDE